MAINEAVKVPVKETPLKELEGIWEGHVCIFSSDIKHEELLKFGVDYLKEQGIPKEKEYTPPEQYNK